MNWCRENSKCTGPLLLEFTKTVYKRSLMERLDLLSMVVLLNLRAKIPPFESKSAHSSRKLPMGWDQRDLAT
jgi:hypothetical protein